MRKKNQEIWTLLVPFFLAHVAVTTVQYKLLSIDAGRISVTQPVLRENWRNVLTGLHFSLPGQQISCAFRQEEAIIESTMNRPARNGVEDLLKALEIFISIPPTS
jgi:hypothetical protein